MSALLCPLVVIVSLNTINKPKWRTLLLPLVHCTEKGIQEGNGSLVATLRVSISPHHAFVLSDGYVWCLLVTLQPLFFETGTEPAESCHFS